MKAITIKSNEVLDEALQTEIHHTFGMEHYTDYVFKPREDQTYSATLVMEDSSELIHNVKERSTSFPDHEFVIEVLDTDSNMVKKYYIKEGEFLKITNR
ncbi:MAG: hypothetical protein ABFS28_06000 [Bacteroidota bacterium]